MSNQEILNTLSQMESELYYRYSGGADREQISYDNLMIMHSMIDECLNTWHRMTGLVID